MNGVARGSKTALAIGAGGLDVALAGVLTPAAALAFLVVGLVASVKIGGGGDLHNMDMFLIGLLFTSALAWQNGGSDWIQNGKMILHHILQRAARLIIGGMRLIDHRLRFDEL